MASPDAHTPGQSTHTTVQRKRKSTSGHNDDSKRTWFDRQKVFDESPASPPADNKQPDENQYSDVSDEERTEKKPREPDNDAPIVLPVNVNRTTDKTYPRFIKVHPNQYWVRLAPGARYHLYYLAVSNSERAILNPSEQPDTPLSLYPSFMIRATDIDAEVCDFMLDITDLYTAASTKSGTAYNRMKEIS